MASKIEQVPAYRNTMLELENLKKTNSQGMEYWLAREIRSTLGYSVWDKFEPVIGRAAASMRSNSIDPSHHIALTSNMMGVGKGGTREVADYFLSRSACRLIAMNGDPTKPEVAGAQAYFLVQAERMERHDANEDDEERFRLREKVKKSFKVVSGVAQDVGVPGPKQGIFHDARYQGLYKMTRREMMASKGIDPKTNVFDVMGALELSANDFQMNLAAETIKKENVQGEARAIQKNKEVAQRVRRTMIDSGSNPPEDLPPAEPIKEVVKRIKKSKPKKIA